MTDQTQAPNGTVSVRMYRNMLGDCFLLTHRHGDEVFRALIDCGALQRIGSVDKKPQTEAALQNLGQVVADIAQETGGVLDLVIATHEHYDHLSGFIKHDDVFETFTIKSVWLAWTENDKDDLANAIRARRSKGLEALKALVGTDPDEPSDTPTAALAARFGVEADNADVKGKIAGIRNLLQFYGEIDEPRAPGTLAAGGTAAPPRAPKLPPKSCADVFFWLKTKAGEQNVRYLLPGQRIAFGLGGVLQASVLGPPRTRSRLLKLDPDGDEIYLTPAAIGEYLPLADDVSSLLGLDSPPLTDCGGAPCTPNPARADVNLPFVAAFDRWEDEAAEDSLWKDYFRDEPVAEARRVDGDWLGSAEMLALKIDGDVNNTSLALAIEVPGRRVLLFPADAQIGNWESWHDQKYPSGKDPDTGKDIPPEAGECATDILARVVLYKVGHHGSHNATLRGLGLELMTHPELAAMIPVVEEVAKEQVTSNNPDGWAMPYDHLYSALKAKTVGRILRGDGDIAKERAAFAASTVFTLDYAEGDEPLWVSVTLGA